MSRWQTSQRRSSLSRAGLAFVAVSLLSGRAWAQSSDRNHAFESWVEQVAQSERLRVTQLASGQLGEDASVERAALLCDPAGSARAYWLLEKDARHRWALAVQRELPVDCPRWNGHWTSLSGAIEASTTADRVTVREEVGFRNGIPVLLRSEASEAEGTEPLRIEDWQRLTFGAKATAASEGTRIEGTIVAALPGRAQPATARNFTMFGPENWSGPADASIQAQATALPDGNLRIRLTITDDVRVPIPENANDRTFISVDHAELWWTQPESSECISRPTHVCGLRQLGIAFKAGGGLDVRWLYPYHSREPFPKVTQEGNDLVLVLPGSILSEAHGARGRFTAAYSDADTASGGQQTLVATSRLRWAKPETFGILTAWPEGGQYPSPAHGEVFCDAWRLGEGTRFR